MDKFEQIASHADFCVALLGNLQTCDYEVVDLSPAVPVSAETSQSRRDRGLYFLGVAGMVQGVPQTPLEDAYGPEVTDALSAAYVCHVEASMRENIEVLSLMHLHGLPDPRSVN